MAWGLGLSVQALACDALYAVEAGHRAIIYNRLRGISDRVYFEGTHFCIPFFERPIIYDVRTRPRVLMSLSGSRGKHITCVLLYADQ